MLKTDTFGQGPNLTLLHGWAAQNSDWKGWAEIELAPYFTVTLIELPGFGNSDALPNSTHIEADWISAITAELPAKTHLLGWSLGGLLAQKIAKQSPQRIQSLICLASTPRFTQADDWQWAVSPTLIGDFIHAIGSDTAATLKHFWKLQIQGSDGARQLFKELNSKIKNSRLPSMKGLLQGLELLKSIDCRPCAQDIQCPVLWLLGENDPLIPKDFMTEFSTIQPTAKVEILPGAAHMPFLSHPTETAAQIIAFLKSQ
jgi:pimeloyl-[acyl-carrier protein] methyl ester esterase